MMTINMVTAMPRNYATYEDLYVRRGFSVRSVAAELGVASSVAFSDMQKLGIAMREHAVATDVMVGRESLYADVALRQTRQPASTCLANDKAWRESSGSVKNKDLNTSFFASIDSDVKAYTLGLAWSDGSLDSSRLRIRLQEEDAPALEAIRVAMGAGPLLRYEPGEKGTRATVMLQVCSVRLVHDLRLLGFCENKTDRVPNAANVPDAFRTSFVRGLVDGDGSLYGASKYPQITFCNHNASLRKIVSDTWERMTGRRPATYAPIVNGVVHPRVNEVGHYAAEIAAALYLHDDSLVAFPRKRERAQLFQDWSAARKT